VSWLERVDPCEVCGEYRQVGKHFRIIPGESVVTRCDGSGGSRVRVEPDELKVAISKAIESAMEWWDEDVHGDMYDCVLAALGDTK